MQKISGKIQNSKVVNFFIFVSDLNSGSVQSLIWTTTLSDLDSGLLAVQIRVLYRTSQTVPAKIANIDSWAQCPLLCIVASGTPG